MDLQRHVTIVAISSSRWPASSIGALVTAAERLSSASVTVSACHRLRDLPAFDPALDGGDPIPSVAEWRDTLQAADALLICSPEYAYGLPGVLQNALDWLKRRGDLAGKPVALVNTSPHAVRPWAPLVDTITAMAARVIMGASIAIPLRPLRPLTAADILSDGALATALLAVVTGLARAVRARHGCVGRCRCDDEKEEARRSRRVTEPGRFPPIPTC
jgi:NAD(P)H-dependent FMN reductase